MSEGPSLVKDVYNNLVPYQRSRQELLNEQEVSMESNDNITMMHISYS